MRPTKKKKKKTRNRERWETITGHKLHTQPNHADAGFLGF